MSLSIEQYTELINTVREMNGHLQQGLWAADKIANGVTTLHSEVMMLRTDQQAAQKATLSGEAMRCLQEENARLNLNYTKALQENQRLRLEIIELAVRKKYDLSTFNSGEIEAAVEAILRQPARAEEAATGGIGGTG